MPDTESISEYLARIGSKGGKAKGKRNALKYHTEEERKAARKASQDAYRARKKKEKRDASLRGTD